MQNDEQDIRQLVSTWMAATRAGDIETVLSLMADDVVFLVAGQPVMRKADFEAAARAMSKAGAPAFDGSSEIQEIKVLGDCIHVDKTHCGGDPAGWQAAGDPGGPHAVHSAQTKRQMGAGSRCQPADSRAGMMGCRLRLNGYLNQRYVQN